MGLLFADVFSLHGFVNLVHFDLEFVLVVHEFVYFLLLLGRE